MTDRKTGDDLLEGMPPFEELHAAVSARIAAGETADPADLKDLPYPELIRRKEMLGGEIEAISIEGGIFDGRLPPRLKDLEAIQDALSRKRAESAGKGTKHKRKGEGPDDGESGRGLRDAQGSD